MTTKKKRTGLDALGLGTSISSIDTNEETDEKTTGVHNLKLQKVETQVSPTGESKKKGKSKKEEIAKTTVYAPKAVFEQWRELAFTERKKMHDYLLEGLDRVFADRGLKSIAKLTGKE